MKKFIKGRWFPLIVAISILVLVVGVVLVMALLGWRFTYAPELENSWEAISAVASWVGVIMSFLAVMAAVWIPKRIADQQDKISLFEKRFEVYDKLQKCKVFADIFKERAISNKEGIRFIYFASIFDYKDTLSYNDSLKVLSTSKNIFELFCQSRFWYSKNISDYLCKTGNALKEFMTVVADTSTSEDNLLTAKQKSFLDQFGCMYDEIIEQMRIELNLYK